MSITVAAIICGTMFIMLGAITFAAFYDDLPFAPENRAYNPRYFDAEHIRYATTRQNARTMVEVKGVIAEKGKEPMYVVNLVDIGETVEIPQSIYDEYIGDGHNAITYVCNRICMYVATARGENIFETCKAYTVARNILPWDKDKTEFAPAEVQEFFRVLCDKKAKFDFDALPFQFDGHNRSLQSISNENLQKYARFVEEH